MKTLAQGLARRFGVEFRRTNRSKVPYEPLPMNERWLERFDYFRRMMDRVETLAGDIVECGVGGGRSLFMLAHLIGHEPRSAQRRLLGFDSFAGFPQPAPEDASPRNPQKGEWRATNPEAVLMFLRCSGISEELIRRRIELVPGFLEDTLPAWPSRPIALLHVDVDLYEAYRVALRCLFPHVVEGGLVLFDEYGEASWPGATKAIDEYFAGTPYRLERDSRAGKWFVVKHSEPISGSGANDPDLSRGR